MVSMPKKANGEFNQKNYIAEWKRKNMKYVSAAFKSEFVEEFREACKKLNVKQADLIREMMEKAIKKAAALK